MGELWSVSSPLPGSAVPCSGLLAGSMAFPPGITVEGATPLKGRVKVSFCVSPFTPARCRTSGQKRGVAPSTSTPLVRRAAAPGGRGTREAQPRIASSQRTREIRVVPRLMRRFVKVSNHNGECYAL